MGEELKNENLPAAFWDALPENGDDNPDMAAINALLEESTPEERAENFKVQGNDLYTKAIKLRTNNKFYVRKAVEAYSKGIAVGCSNSQLMSVLHSNRAQAHLKLCNNRAALQDASKACKEDVNNVKAYYRAAQAAMRMGMFEDVLRICSSGLTVEPTGSELRKLQEEASAKAAAAKAEAVSAVAKAKQKEDATRYAPARRIAAALFRQGWKWGLPQFRLPVPSLEDCTPFMAEDGRAHSGILFIYPQAPQQPDFIQDFGGEDTLGAHLDEMFQDGAPLEWDTKHEYTRERVRVYYLTHQATPLGEAALVEVLAGKQPSNVHEEGPSRYGPKASTWKHVAESARLADVLAAPDYVSPGIPIFFVVAEGTEFKQRLLSGEQPMF